MHSAIAEILQHEERLMAYISRRIRDRSRASDILQETMLRLIEQSQKQDLANPLAYAYRVADSVVYAEARRSRVMADPLDFDLPCDLPLADEVLEQKQRVVVFESTLSKLSPTRRRIFIKRHLEGQSRQAIADDMNMSVEAVKKHLVRAMVDLAEALDAREVAAPSATAALQARPSR